MEKLRVGLLFGGRSVEHEVSLASATSILKALDPTRYDVALIAIGHDGRWHLGAPPLPPEAAVEGQEVTLPAVPGQRTITAASVVLSLTLVGRRGARHSGNPEDRVGICDSRRDERYQHLSPRR